MKQQGIILLIVCLLCSLFGCRQREYPPILMQADSLAVANPDSAVTLLVNLDEEMNDEAEAVRMYYHLLCIKAKDKAYILHNSDSAILSVLHYYIEKDDHRHLPEAYYYAGRVYRDLGDSPQALEYFTKAVETLPEDDLSVLKGKIYSQMGTLFSYQGLEAEALKVYQKCLALSIATKDSVSLCYDLRDIGNIYRKLNIPDSALVYLKQAKEESFRLQRKNLSVSIQGLLASTYIDLQQYDSARIALQYTLENVKRSNQSSVYSIAALYYHSVGKMDSAYYYYSKLLECGGVYAKRSAHAVFLEFSAYEKDFDQVIHHLRQYHEYTDSIQKITETESVERMHSLYNYQLREKENQKLKAEKEQRQRMIGLGLVTLVCALLLLGHYIRRKKRQLEEQICKYQQIERERVQKQASIENYKHQKETLELQLRDMVVPDKNKAAIRKMEQKLEWLNHILGQAKIESEQEAEAQAHLFCSEMYQTLCLRAGSARGDAYVLSEEWEVLKVLITSAYPSFFTHLEYLYALNENELHVCMLLKLKFRPADIARLLQLKPETISSIRKRLCQKVTGKSGTSEQWDKIIHSL